MIGILLMSTSLAAAAQTNHAEATSWAAETLASLSLEEKVAQMICEQMRGEYTADDSKAFLYWSRLARDYGIGGFVVYGGTPRDAAHLLNRLQKLAKIPLLISSDFEGGPGQQFEGASEFPANMALSAAGSETLAYEVGKVGAIEGRAIGIHLTYSPVVDVQTRPNNPVLSVRSFGSDVELLGKMASAYIRGYQENGMLATAKHFPGRGDVDLMGDTEFLINSKPATRIEAEDLAAFKKAIDAGVTFVMSEHIAIPSLTDGSDLPASVEAKLASYWLRERLGFENVLTTDDLWYPKVVDTLRRRARRRSRDTRRARRAPQTAKRHQDDRCRRSSGPRRRDSDRADRPLRREALVLEVYADAFIRLLKGEIEARGKLPVSLSSTRP